MNDSSSLIFDAKTREALWSRVKRIVEDYAETVDNLPVAPGLDVEEIRSLFEPIEFETAMDPMAVIDFVVQGLMKHQVHTPHTRYFGLFNPAPADMGVVADAITAAFNPQLAAWSHSPFAVETERHLIRALGGRFGYDPASTSGAFTSGGAEANHTALLTALTWSFPDFAASGVRRLPAAPVFYVSEQSHHSFIKAARFSGLGTDSVRQVDVNENFQMDPVFLASRISEDKKEGFAPFMVVGTAGTTNAGIVDPLPHLADVARKDKLWFHVDAAWGGAAALEPRLRRVLAGVERADSITFDAHKWLSAPMGAGIYLTRHTDILNETCRITTEYMPRDADEMDIADPYTHSMQWSRRFIGLKVFMALAAAGWRGCASAIRHQVEMGRLLRRKLEESNWTIINRTELPVVCFVDGKSPDGESAPFLEAIARAVVASGKAWISPTSLDEETPVLRACITNVRTQPDDIRALVQTLNEAREKTGKIDY